PAWRPSGCRRVSRLLVATFCTRSANRRTFRITNNLTGTRIYHIVGVAGVGFTGTEPGKVVDIFLPAMMHWGMSFPECSLFRTCALATGYIGPAGTRPPQRDGSCIQRFEGKSRETGAGNGPRVRGSLRDAEELSYFARRPRRTRRAGAANCLCERSVNRTSHSVYPILHKRNVTAAAYSYLNTSAGAMRVALRAGSIVARKLTRIAAAATHTDRKSTR